MDCINQADTTERNGQASQASRVYGNTQEVLVLLELQGHEVTAEVS